MQTLTELLCVYETHRDIKKSTFDQYSWCIVSFEKHLGRVARTGDLTVETINDWLRFMRGTCSPYTCKSRRMTILSLWRFASEIGLCSQPVGRVRIVKTPERCFSTLSFEECRAVIRAANELRGKYRGYPWNHLMRTWIVVTLETSLRPSDMVRLSWQQVAKADGQLQIVQQKTGRRRRISISQSTLADIGHWHRDDPGRIWPLERNNIAGRKIQQISDTTGIQVTHTLLRKTAITDVEAQQPGAGWIFAGHSSPATTRQWYTDADRAYRDIPKPRFRQCFM